MVKPEMIPDGSLEASARNVYACWYPTWSQSNPFESAPDWIRDKCYEVAREAIAAALSAWPGMDVHVFRRERGDDFIILPLPETQNDRY